MGSLLSLLRAYMPSFPWTYDCCFLLSSWWHTLGSRVGRPYSSGQKRRMDGISILVNSLRDVRKRWRWWTFLHLRRRARCLRLPSLSLPRKVMILLRLVLILSRIREAFSLLAIYSLRVLPLLLLVPVLTGVLLQADLIVLHQSHLWMLFLHLYQPRLPLPRGEYVISKLCFFFTLVIY